MSDLPELKSNHYCRFLVLTGSMSHTDYGYRYTERCKCGRLNEIVIVYSVGKDIGTKVRKSWFDREGHLVRITGTDDDHKIIGLAKDSTPANGQ